MKNIQIARKTSARGAMRLVKVLFTSTIILVVSGTTSYAAGIIEEITVTARKRAENVQEIPVAISVLGKDIVDDGNFDELSEYMELVPNATFSTDSFTSTEISIRGSARNVSDEDPSVGIYRDGIYIGGLLFSSANFYDMEQVEVLRGPQAGLYGRNAVGGALSVTSVRPEYKLDGYVDIQIASRDRQEYRMAANVPVVDDRWALRVAGLVINQDKGFNHVTNQDQYLDAQNNKSFRLRSLYEPGNNLELLTTIDYIDAEGGVAGIVIAPDAAGGFVDSAGTFFIAGTDSDDTDNLQKNVEEIRDFDQIHIFQEINYEMEWGTLTGLGSYRDADFISTTDADFTNFDLGLLEFDAKQESIFAEIRFASKDFNGFRFTAGVNFLDDDTTIDFENLIGGEFGLDLATLYATGVVTPDISAAFGLPIGLPIGFLGLTAGATGWTGALGDSFPTEITNRQDLQSIAVFFEGNYAVTDRIELWANLRYTHDKKSIAFTQRFTSACQVACPEIFALLLGIDPQIGADSSETFDNLSPGGGINFQFNDDILTYAKIVTGFKAGGFNSISGSLANLPFDAEKTISYEIGAKSVWFDRRLKANFAAFYQKRKNALVQVIDPDMPINSLGVNAGKIENKGVELELSLRPTEGLKLEVAAGYLDSKFEDFITFGLDFSGNQVPRTFKYSLSSVASYHYPITDAMELFSFLSYTNGWKGSTDHDNLEKMDNPEIVDLRLGLKGDTWKLVGFIDNVTNNRYTTFETNGTNLGGRHWGVFSPGRTYGVQAVYNFK